MLKKYFWTKSALLLFFTFSALHTSGCANVDALEDVVSVGSNTQQRLQKRLDKFTKALYWGSINEASSYVEPELRSKFFRKESQFREGQRLVDLDIKDVEYSEDEATVRLKVKYYKQTNYIVNSRYDEQYWRFHRFGGGWYCWKIKRDVGPADYESDESESEPLEPKI